MGHVLGCGGTIVIDDKSKVVEHTCSFVQGDVMKALRSINRASRTQRRVATASLAGTAGAALVLLAAVFVPVASATPTVSLGTAAPFAILAGSAVTFTTPPPPSVITGNLGLDPAAGTFYNSGVTQAQVTGTIYSNNASGPGGYVTDAGLLTNAKNDLTTAFGTASGLTPTDDYGAGENQLGGKTLTAGVYAFGHGTTANITTGQTLTLNGQGNPNAIFVFQASSDLVTASGSVVQLENDAQACNVYWEVDSSATLNSGSTFVGTIMAYDSITLSAGVNVQGRLLAETALVSLIQDTITVPSTCLTSLPSSSATTTTTTAAAPASSGTGVIPSGSPGTGHGGASLSHEAWLIAAGALALGGAGISTGLAVRRRRVTTVPSNPSKVE
jgi:hypothetical protein